MVRLLFVFFTFAVGALFGTPRTLKKQDVRASMEEIFNYHVEAKGLSPLLVKRSFKIYMEQFDPQRLYLLQDEVKSYFELSSEQLASVIKNYYKDDLSDYEALNRMIVKAVKRSRKLREGVIAELAAQGIVEESKVEKNYIYYARDEEELKARIRTQLVRALEEDRFLGGPEVADQDRRHKVFALAERRWQRHEAPYLPKKKKEHSQVLLILKAMAKSLDAHTAYFSPEEAHEMRTSLEKQFEGIGVVLKEGVDGVVITGLVKGGPAERSGQIQPGDLLAEIDGYNLSKASYEEILVLLQGKGQKNITLGLSRAGVGALIRVELTREKIVIEEGRLQYSAERFGSGIIGKLTLPSFYESDSFSSERDIREALRDLRRQGNLLGVVLDLRENLGGFLSQAVKVAGLFMSSGVVVISKYAKGEIQYLREIDTRIYYNGPLVILTSKASASAAEIVAQALQDYGIAVVVGDERTYGKGTIQFQTVTDANAKAFFKVTVGKYYTVSGRSTQIEGVQTDIHVPTEFCIYNIGERYLEYPLPNDQVPSAYNDTLSDIDVISRRWYQKHYLPYAQKKESIWYQMMPMLKDNSAYRLDKDPNFKLFLQNVEAPKKGARNWGVEDLQVQEAVNIVKDMLSGKRSAAA